MAKKILFIGAGAMLGAIGGFLYWKLVGCYDGSCMIWSNPYKSTGYGAMMGLLLGWGFIPGKSSK